MNQSADSRTADVDGKPTPGNQGAWESTGVVDASSVFGAGAFLINVQAHTLWVEKAPGYDTFIDANDRPRLHLQARGRAAAPDPGPGRLVVKAGDGPVTLRRPGR